MLHKNPGFIVIDIEVMDLIEKQKERIKKVMSIVYKKQSIITIIYNFIYYYLFRYLNCYRFFEINTLFFNTKSAIENNLSFYIFDYGIQFYGNNINFLIPYEYILEFGIKSDLMILHVFAKFNDENKIELSNEITVISFLSVHSKNIMKSIKLNMEYHILHNTIDTDILSYKRV